MGGRMGWGGYRVDPILPRQVNVVVLEGVTVVVPCAPAKQRHIPFLVKAGENGS